MYVNYRLFEVTSSLQSIFFEPIFASEIISRRYMENHEGESIRINPVIDHEKELKRMDHFYHGSEQLHTMQYVYCVYEYLSNC